MSNLPDAPRSVDTDRSRASRNPLARLDRIPVWPYERKLLWILGAGYFFAFFDIVTIAFALPVIAQLLAGGDGHAGDDNPQRALHRSA